MTDMRRIELSSVKTSEKEPKVKRKVKTVRLVLKLGESNATSCPEYSFADLIKAENDKQDRNAVRLDPFGDNDEEREVAAIAQRFEAKYGTKSFKSGKKRQTQDMDDYYDVGDGYDVEDPFIDNTEAYDEVVPSTLTTKYGGFYINQGKLDFKSISDDSNDSFAVDRSKKKNKRKIIESDSDEETPEAIAKKFKAMKRKKLLEGREAEKKKKKLGSGMNGDVSIIKKKKKKNFLKLKQSSKEEPHSKETKEGVSVSATQKQATSTTASVPTTTSVTTSPAPVTVSTVTTTPSSVSPVNGDNVAPKEEKKVVPEDITMKDSSNVVINVDDSSSKSGDEEKKSEATSEEKNTQLPSSLPSQLAEDIAKIKQLAKINTEGKSKFFSGNTNKLLLTIENESFKLSKSHRSAIFNHLAEHLPTSGKTALLRRAKKLRQAQSESPLKGPMDRLREAVKLAMPKAIEEHQMIIAKARLEAKPNGADTTTEDAATESDEDENKTTDTKKTRMPRRKFSWTPEIIELFLKVVEVKMRIYNSLKVKSQSPEDYLKAFLEAEVKPIWPNNWMNTRALLKLHREETSKSGKSKKNFVSGKASPVPTSDSPMPSQQSASKMDPVVEIFSKKTTDAAEETRRNNISMDDDIIEISSIIDDDVEERKSVVVNLPDSDVKSTLSISNLHHTPARPSPSAPSNIPRTQAKPESKPIPSKSSSSSVPISDHLYNSVKKLPDKPGTGNNAASPIVLPESPKTPGTPLRMGTVISTPVPKSTSTPVLTGSNVTPSGIPLSNRSFLQALEPPSLQQGGALPSKPQVSLLSPHQQQKPSSNILNAATQAFQPQQKQQQQQKKQLASSQIRNNSNNTQPNKSGSNLYLTQQQPKMPLLKEAKITLMHHKIGQSLSNVNSSNSSVGSKAALSNTASVPTTNPLAAPKPSTPLSVTRVGGNTAVANKVSYANQQRSPAQQNNQPSVNLSTQQHKPQHHNIKPPHSSPAGQVQATIVSPPGSQLGRKSGPAASSSSNTSPVSILTNSGGTAKQQLSRQQQHKSPSSSSLPHSSPNYLASRNNQFVLNNKSSAMSLLSQTLPAGSQVKSGIVLGTTPPKSKQQTTNSNRNAGSSTTKPLLIQTSMLSSSNLSPSSIFSASRTSTPSPQKSPASPGTTASALFDHIQSQILNQEATQEQGLKVLAMAMKNIEGKPKLGQGSTQSPPGKYK